MNITESKELESQQKTRNELVKEIENLHTNFHQGIETNLFNFKNKLAGSGLSDAVMEELLSEVKQKFPNNNLENFVPITEVKKIFGNKFIGPVFVNELFGTTFVPRGLKADYKMLEAGAKAGMYLVMMPAMTLGDMIKKTASKKQKDGVVNYYPDQFDLLGNVANPWFKNVNGINYCPYILNMVITKPYFVLTTAEVLDNTPNKVVSKQIPIQKQFAFDTFKDSMSQDLILTCNSLTPEVLDMMKQTEKKDWKIATVVTLSNPFVQKFWLNLAEDIAVYAGISASGRIIRRRMYSRVCSASPFDDILMFGFSGDGSFVSNYRAGSACSGVGVPFSCRIESM